ncbi:MAG: sigma 54-interacting transcriptional regulator [Deltaproteobacteria bacterium]|nr:sigma 54-interacting transcriptional regulator [Deltaproteobacteria bacterium]
MPEFVLDETERVSWDRRGMRVLSIALVVIEGPERGLRIQVKDGAARVGSSEGCDLRLTDRSVSRVHCELTVLADRVTVKDLGSTNGTRIGEVSIRDADVGPGAVIRCGSSAFRIDAADEPAFVAISERTSFGELVGASLEMRQVYAVLERVATTDATLLVQGETGTGKDVVARAVHSESARREGPFVPVDCGAIPETLFESELFGHVRGAFTGAINNRAGAFEEANGGTLFLDEIGEMPLAMQAKLLRVIESRRVKRVGATKETDIDVRIVAATNRKLAQMVNEGTFREDLYYRLAVVEVSLPPLRARRDDIPAIAAHLFAKIPHAKGKALPPELVDSLKARPWPGNVRELRNAIERAVTMGHAVPEGTAAPTGDPSVLPAGIESIIPLHLPLKDARLAWTNEFESIYARAMLKKADGNLTRAAEEAGVSRRFFQRMIARLGLRDASGALPIDDGDDD